MLWAELEPDEPAMRRRTGHEPATRQRTAALRIPRELSILSAQFLERDLMTDPVTPSKRRPRVRSPRLSSPLTTPSSPRIWTARS